MKQGLKLITAVVLAGLLIGCASMGRNFDESKVSQIKKSETTEAELVQMFGAPEHRTLNSEGQTILTWMYSQSNVKGQSFIPFAGPFMGGTDTKMKSLNVTLLNDKVVSFSSTGGAT